MKVGLRLVGGWLVVGWWLVGGWLVLPTVAWHGTAWLEDFCPKVLQPGGPMPHLGWVAVGLKVG